VHNNYLTLPVLLTMLAGHASFLYAREHAWLVLLALMALAAWARLFFNLRHAGRTVWTIPAVGAAALLALAIGLEPDDDEPTAGGPAVAFSEVQAIVDERCVTCHTGAGAPAGVAFDRPDAIVARADDIRTLVASGTMPPGNQTGMTEAERDTIVAWARQGAGTG
jgi:uncharacterized membrane protein